MGTADTLLHGGDILDKPVLDVERKGLVEMRLADYDDIGDLIVVLEVYETVLPRIFR